MESMTEGQMLAVINDTRHVKVSLDLNYEVLVKPDPSDASRFLVSTRLRSPLAKDQS